ncbi:hypothetical protein [Halorubrum vacuolatum]|nr:hypothetical protein [Halorubrum vacuolatum]
MVAKKVYNLFPHGSKIARVDLERRVGNKSDFVITDLLSDPARVAIEVIYKNTDLGLQRRLRTLFDEGYAVMLVVVTTSDLHPDRLERYLKRVGPIQVGQFDPSTMATRLGSLVRPGTIDIDAQVWDVLPQYLS